MNFFVAPVTIVSRVRAAGELRLKLHGLDPSASYEISDQDKEGISRISGRELLDSGLLI